MPIIAPMRQPQALEAKNPVPIASSEDARIAGESIEKGGAGLANAGSGLADFFSVTDRAMRAEIINANKQWAQTWALNRVNELDKQDTSPDGSKTIPTFQEDMEDQIKERLKGVDNEETRLGSETAMRSVMNAHIADMVPVVMKKRHDYVFKLGQQNVSSASAMIEANPDLYLQTKQEWENGHILTGDFYGPEKIKIQNLFNHEAAKSAINGYAKQGRFDEARKFLIDEGGKYFDAEKGEVDAFNQKIDKAEYDAKDRAYKDEERKEREAKEQLEKTRDKVFGHMLTQTMSVKNDAEREATRIQNQKFLAAGLLNAPYFNLLEKIADKGEVSDQNSLAIHYFDRLAKRESPAAIERDLVKDALNDRVGHTDAKQIFGILRQERKDRSPEEQRRFQAGKEIFNKLFSKENPWLPESRDEKVRNAQAYAEFLARSEKSDPVESVFFVARKWFGESVGRYVPGVPVEYQDVGTFDKAKRWLVEQFKAKQIPQKEAEKKALELKNLEQMMNKMREIEKNTEKKPGGK